MKRIIPIILILMNLISAYAEDVSVVVNVTGPARITAMLALARFNVLAYIALVFIVSIAFAEFILKRFFEIKGIWSAVTEMIVLIIGILMIVYLFTL